MTISRDLLIAWLEKLAGVMKENKDLLTELDAAIGDADHGINMDRGFGKVLEKLPTLREKDVGAILQTVGMTLMSSVGGASGPLYGTFFMKAGMALAGKEEIDAPGLVTFLEAGIKGILQRGRAARGDKTMVDVWLPVFETIKAAISSGASVQDALATAVVAAEKGVEDTIPLQARKGRASYLGERSIGHRDPGAVSSCLIISALQEVLKA
jgi:phosphoenolpyruvate---glycerone phosphotransferase subunit DhaL